jgi:acyl phosphate:glycerol-3-phosphate acyltransferase
VVIPLLFILLAYVLGATPTSYLVGRLLFGIDLREKGSGNLGATNTYRVLGWKAAIPVGLVDVLKGWLPVWYFPQRDQTAVWEWALAYAAAAIVGHVFSFWVRFKGGKGIATSAGAFLALAPWATLVALGAWIGTVFLTRIVSVASLAAAVALPLALIFLPHRGGTTILFFTLALAAFVFWAHRSNIRRLLRGEEHRFGKGRGKGGKSGVVRKTPGEATSSGPNPLGEAPSSGPNLPGEAGAPSPPGPEQGT